MNEKNIISTRVKTSIEEQKEDIPAKDFRFYHFDQIIRIVEKLELIENCIVCIDLINEFDEVLVDIKKIMDDRNKRIQLENLIDRSVKYLRKEHNFYLPKFFNYTFSFIGMITGLGIGIAAAYIRDYPNKILIILPGWFIGLVIGRIIGGLKDSKLKKTGKQI